MLKSLIKAFFTLPHVLGRTLPGDDLYRRDRFLKDIVETLVNSYVKRYRLEDVQLDNTLLTYGLRGLLSIHVGLLGEELYYVIQEPPTTETELGGVIDRFIVNITSNRDQGEDYRFKGEDVAGDMDKITYNFIKITSGWGPLTPFILDPYVEDISLSKSTGRVYVIHNKFSWMGWLKSNMVLEPELVDRLVVSLSRRIKKHISFVNPLAEGACGDGFRVSLLYGDAVSPHGSSLVVRKRSGITWTITKLINEGFLTSIITSYLWLVLENKGWIIIAGHVGSGKTTLLQALLSLIPPYKKVITIEDTPEISGTTGLWEPLVEKSEVFTQTSQIDSFTLLKFALRRRPDYIVIGEVRGVEARLLVQASRLGHGVLNTIHADSPESVLKRLIAPPISIPRNLLNNIWTIVLTGVQGSKRKVVSLSEIGDDTSPAEVCSNTDESCAIERVVSSSTRLGRLYSSKDELYGEIIRRAVFLERLVSKGIFTISDLAVKLLEFYGKVEEAVREYR
ncbi:MAG: type II/IV secretion system ATPase subunit [Desulfurococcaceae archaeon]